MQALSNDVVRQIPGPAALRAQRTAGQTVSICHMLRTVFNAAVTGCLPTPRAVPCTPVLQGCIRALQRQMDIALVHFRLHPSAQVRAACSVLMGWAEEPRTSALGRERFAARLSTIEAGYAACARRLDGAWLRGVETWNAGDRPNPLLRRNAACDVVKAVVAARSALTELQRADPTLR